METPKNGNEKALVAPLVSFASEYLTADDFVANISKYYEPVRDLWNCKAGEFVLISPPIGNGSKLWFGDTTANKYNGSFGLGTILKINRTTATVQKEGTERIYKITLNARASENLEILRGTNEAGVRWIYDEYVKNSTDNKYREARKYENMTEFQNYKRNTKNYVEFLQGCFDRIADEHEKTWTYPERTVLQNKREKALENVKNAKKAVERLELLELNGIEKHIKGHELANAFSATEKRELRKFCQELEPETKKFLIESEHFYDFVKPFFCNRGYSEKVLENYTNFYRISEKIDFDVEGTLKDEATFQFLKDYAVFCEEAKKLLA